MNNTSEVLPSGKTLRQHSLSLGAHMVRHAKRHRLAGRAAKAAHALGVAAQWRRNALAQ